MASLRGLASPLGLLALPLAGLVLALLLLSPPGRGSNGERTVTLDNNCSG